MKKTFYTVQTLNAYLVARNKGVLQSNLQYEAYPEAYEWMKNQMEERIEGYSKKDGMIWLRTEKPDIYSLKETQTKTMVILKVKLDKKRVLPSLFYPWDTIRSNITQHGRILEDIFYETYSISPEGIFNTKGYDEEEIQYTTGPISIKDISLKDIIKFKED